MATFDRLKNVAPSELVSVDMESDRGPVRKIVADGVVLERRNQGARFALSRENRFLFAEVDDRVVGVVQDVVAGDPDAATVNTLHTPFSGVIMKGRALAYVPNHRNHGISPRWVAVHQSPGILIFRRFQKAFWEEVQIGAEQLFEKVLHFRASLIDAVRIDGSIKRLEKGLDLGT